MKSEQLHKTKKTHKSFKDFGDDSRDSHHLSKKSKTQQLAKANTAIDRAIRRKDWKVIMDENY
jgi:hypothetical protein